MANALQHFLADWLTFKDVKSFESIPTGGGAVPRGWEEMRRLPNAPTEISRRFRRSVRTWAALFIGTAPRTVGLSVVTVRASI